MGKNTDFRNNPQMAMLTTFLEFGVTVQRYFSSEMIE